MLEPRLSISQPLHVELSLAEDACTNLLSGTTMGDSAYHLRGMDHKVEHGTGHAAHLDAMEESVNRQIDTDIRVLLDNFREMIHLSRVCFEIYICPLT